jgi:hypothetical protein
MGYVDIAVHGGTGAITGPLIGVAHLRMRFVVLLVFSYKSVPILCMDMYGHIYIYI